MPSAPRECNAASRIGTQPESHEICLDTPYIYRRVAHANGLRFHSVQGLRTSASIALAAADWDSPGRASADPR